MFKPIHSYIPDSQKLGFVLDLETLSMQTNAAIVDIALVEILGAERQFSAQIKPSWYTKDITNNTAGLFHVDHETLAWHQKKHPHYLQLMEQRGEDGTVVAGRLWDFLVQIQEMEQKQVVLYCQGMDFDPPILSYFMNLMIGQKPWHYRNVRDLRSFQALTPEIAYVRGDHTALEDARYSKQHLLKQAHASDFMHRYVFGGS